MDTNLPDQLEARLAQRLPGWSAQRRYSPDLCYGRQAGPAPESVRQAAVLVGLFPDQDDWVIPLTLRPSHMQSHGGQISFPGGMVEHGESSRDAALRETDEELGVAKQVRLLGKLSEFYVFVSGFRVIPWVGVFPCRPTWLPNPAEVEQVIEVPLSHLLNPVSTAQFVTTARGIAYVAPSFVWQEQHIWGATSMMLSELIEIVREIEA